MGDGSQGTSADPADDMYSAVKPGEMGDTGRSSKKPRNSSCHHAREWITADFVLRLAKEIVDNDKRNVLFFGVLGYNIPELRKRRR
jgi:hypothetical protein